MSYSTAADPAIDDTTIGLQMQQFFDEWYYRVLHSGLAYNTDRRTCARMALDLLDAHGLAFGEGEKEEMVRLEEPVMLQQLLDRMDKECRRTFEHFALQLQLVVSATTRVRYSLDELVSVAPYGEEEVYRVKREVAECMDKGDTGITQQILRQCVLEASSEVGELNELHNSWWKNMGDRVGRLARASDEAEKASSELAAVNAQLADFSGEQNAKSKSVLMSMAASTDRGCMEAAFKGWMGAFIKYKAEKDIHEKFRRQIEDQQMKLLDFKAGNKAGMKKLLQRSAAGGDNFLKQTVFKEWHADVFHAKEEAALKAHVDAAKAKMAGFKESQTANTKKVMMRMSSGKDSNLTSMTFQAWSKGLADIKKENELEGATKELEEMLASNMAKKSAEAKQVITRMLGSGEQGLLFMIRGAWNELYKADRLEKESDEAVQNANIVFSKMSVKQKRTVKNRAERTNAAEEELQIQWVFLQWSVAAKIEKVHRHYSGKMDMKKGQLDAVQNMFKSFASQLEQGISTTPRSQRKKSDRGSSQTRQVADANSRPPPPPPPQ